MQSSEFHVGMGSTVVMYCCMWGCRLLFCASFTNSFQGWAPHFMQRKHCTLFGVGAAWLAC
jgi:hypothetical protein